MRCPRGSCDRKGLWIEGEVAVPCACWERVRENGTWRREVGEPEIPRLYRGATLEGSDRRRHPNAWRLGEEWLEAAEEGAWLYLWGPVGTGKTHIGWALLRAWLERWGGAWAVVAPELLEEEARRLARRAPFLLLDDLSGVWKSELAREALFVVLAERDRELRPTVLTSNVGLDGWPEEWRPMVDRIAARTRRVDGRNWVVKLGGPSWRITQGGVDVDEHGAGVA